MDQGNRDVRDKLRAVLESLRKVWRPPPASKPPPWSDEIPVTDEMRAQAFWLVRKYSSYAYIERMYQLYAGFCQGYEKAARRQAPQWDLFLGRTLEQLAKYEAEMARGLALLRTGDPSGYGLIADGLWFREYVQSRRSSTAEVMGTDLSAGLFRWADLAMAMERPIELTFAVEWTYMTILETYLGEMSSSLGALRIPERLEPMPGGTGMMVKHGMEVPVSGIWLPLDLPNPCPNYLRAGRAAPKTVQRTSVHIGPPGYSPNPWRAYTYHEKTDWELLWEDRRYGDGSMPDESGYLDETTALPVVTWG